MSKIAKSHEILARFGALEERLALVEERLDRLEGVGDQQTRDDTYREAAAVAAVDRTLRPPSEESERELAEGIERWARRGAGDG